MDEPFSDPDEVALFAAERFREAEPHQDGIDEIDQQHQAIESNEEWHYHHGPQRLTVAQEYEYVSDPEADQEHEETQNQPDGIGGVDITDGHVVEKTGEMFAFNAVENICLNLIENVGVVSSFHFDGPDDLLVERWGQIEVLFGILHKVLEQERVRRFLKVVSGDEGVVFGSAWRMFHQPFQQQRVDGRYALWGFERNVSGFQAVSVSVADFLCLHDRVAEGHIVEQLGVGRHPLLVVGDFVLVETGLQGSRGIQFVEASVGNRVGFFSVAVCVASTDTWIQVAGVSLFSVVLVDQVLELGIEVVDVDVSTQEL